MRKFKNKNKLVFIFLLILGIIFFADSCCNYEFNNPHEQEIIGPPEVKIITPLDNGTYGSSQIIVSGQ